MTGLPAADPGAHNQLAQAAIVITYWAVFTLGRRREPARPAPRRR